MEINKDLIDFEDLEEAARIINSPDHGFKKAYVAAQCAYKHALDFRADWNQHAIKPMSDETFHSSIEVNLDILIAEGADFDYQEALDYAKNTL